MNIIYWIEIEGMFKYREFIAQIKYKEVISSPVYFIPVLLLSVMIIIEGFHIFNHKQNCKTKAFTILEKS